MNKSTQELKADVSGIKIADEPSHKSVLKYFRREYLIIDTELNVLAEARSYILRSHTYVKLFINAPGFDGYGQGFSRTLGLDQELQAFKRAVKSAGIVMNSEHGDINMVLDAIGAELTEYRYRVIVAHP